MWCVYNVQWIDEKIYVNSQYMRLDGILKIVDSQIYVSISFRSWSQDLKCSFSIKTVSPSNSRRSHLNTYQWCVFVFIWKVFNLTIWSWKVESWANRSKHWRCDFKLILTRIILLFRKKKIYNIFINCADLCIFDWVRDKGAKCEPHFPINTCIQCTPSTAFNK